MTEFTPQKIKQLRGPPIVFDGAMLCQTQFDTYHGQISGAMFLELWQTRGGNWIAVSRFEPDDNERWIDERAIVIDKRDDELAMRLEAMYFWDWENRARDMVRKKLRWDLTVRVD